MTPEGTVKRRVTALLREYNAYYFSPATHGYGASGVPDIVACHKGFFFGIEVKADAKKNKPTKLQMDNLERIEKAGGVAVVIDADSVEHLRILLEGIH